MRLFKKTIALFLFICMYMTILPGDLMQAAFAETLSGGGIMSSYAGVSNYAGGLHETNLIAFRVMLNRSPENYLNGTEEQRNKVLDYYSNRWPTGFDYGTNTIFLVDWDEYRWLYDNDGVHDNNISNGGNIGYYAPGAGLNFLGEDYKQLIIQEAYGTYNSLPTNTFKQKALADFDSGKVGDLGAYGDMNWYQYMPDADSALKVLTYIFGNTGSGYDVGERIKKFVEQGDAVEGNYSRDPKDLNAREKFSVAAGYAGLLICLYSVIASDGSPKRASTAGYYEAAINDYVANRNLEEKPCALVVDVGISMVHSLEGISYVMPMIDLMQYMGLNDETESLTNANSFIVTDNDGSIKNNTCALIKRMFAYSNDRISFNQLYTDTGDVSKPVRLMDFGLYRNGDGSNMGDFAHHPIIWAHYAFFFGTYQPNSSWRVILNSRSGPQNGFGTGSGTKNGFLNALKLDANRDIYGFIISGNHISNPVPEVSYYVEAEMNMLSNACEPEAQIEKPPVITIYIKGDSSLISALNSRKDLDSFEGVKVVSHVSRKEYLNGMTESNLQSEEDHVTEIEEQINRILKGDELISVLEGNPIQVMDTTLLDASGAGKIYEKATNAQKTIVFQYDVNLDITIDKQTYYYGSADYDDKERTEIAVKGDNGVPYNTSEMVVPLFSATYPTPEDIVITAPESTDTTEVIDPSENENLAENTWKIKSFSYSTEGAQFAEIKNNTPLNEQYEVMAGVPSSEELYFSVGGSEFQLAMAVQYWMNEHSRDRTYTVHFDGNICEYNNPIKGKGDSWEGIDLPTPTGASSQTTTRLEHATSTIVNYDGVTNPNKYGPLTVTVTWEGQIKNTATAATGTKTALHTATATATCKAIVDNSDYQKAVQNANAWMKAMADLSAKMQWTAASDGKTRKIKIDQMDIGTGEASTTQGTTKTGSKNFKSDKELMTGSVTYTYTNPSDKSDSNTATVGCSKGEDTPCGHEMATANVTVPPDGPKLFKITVTYTIVPHALCGPCCEHVMPDLWDTWRQGLVFDFAKISQIRLYKLDQGSVTGMKELTGTDTIFANVMTGNPTYFMNIAQMTEKERFGKVLPTIFDSTIYDYKAPGDKNTAVKNNMITYFGEANGKKSELLNNALRHSAQSSRAGRLRYILAEGQSNQNIAVKEQGQGSSYNFTFNPNFIAAPDQHDDVIYHVGSGPTNTDVTRRSMNCDGMATSGNFGKDVTKNADPTTMTGHQNDWADGCLYTNVLNKTVQSGIPNMTTALSSYSDYWDAGNQGKYTGSLLKTFVDNDSNIINYKEDYNHHVVREEKLKEMNSTLVVNKDGELSKVGYSDAADEKDTKTAEWQFFNAARRTKIVVHVISDFLILQTSGGDQSILYYDKASEPTEAQEHFQKVKIPADELFKNNPLSIFVGDLACESSGDVKAQYTPDFIMVGGYNGQYNKPTEKYKPYNIQDGKFKKFYNAGWTKYDTTSKTPNLSGYASTTSTGNYLGNAEIITIFDTDPAGTIKRPARQATTQNTSFKIYQDNIQILPTVENRLYTPYNGKVFYSQEIGYYNIDEDAIDAGKGNMTPGFVDTIGNVNIGVTQYEKFADYYRTYWGNANGVDYETKYYMLPGTATGLPDNIVTSTTDSGGTTVNPVVIYTPVSTEDAIVMELDPLVKGERDQRVNSFDYPDMNDRVNSLKMCPLDPELCEYRYLDCKYTKDTVLAEFDFNSYTKSGSNYVITDKVSGVKYTLPSGFSISGNRLYASNAKRWAIPMSSLGLSNNKSNKVKVEMDVEVSTGCSCNNLMLVSFYNYGFLLNNGGKLGSFITRSKTGLNSIGARNDINTTITKGQNKHLALTFGFNNIVDSKAVYNNVVQTNHFSEYRKVWKDVGNQRQLLTEQHSITDTVNDAPEDFNTTDIGSNLIIGDWGSDTSSSKTYNAHYYIDNLKITLLGGSHTHDSTCYKKITTHQTKRIHVHTADCYAKEETYICDETPNTNYQLGCGLSTGSGGTSRTIYVFNHNSGCTYAGATHYSTDKNKCSCDHPSCVGTSNVSQTLLAGQCVWLHSNKESMHISTTSDKCSVCGKSTGSVTITASGHVHTGTAGLSYANGCYTKATEHKHTSSCEKVAKGQIMCTGELNATTDFNTHVHNQNCLTQSANIEPFIFEKAGQYQTFTVPYTDDYVIETIGPRKSSSSTVNYAKATVHLQQGQVFYVAVGKYNNSFNSYTSDVRLLAYPSTNREIGEGMSLTNAQKDSDNSRIVAGGDNTFAKSVGSLTVKDVVKGTKSPVNSGNGRVTITCKNTTSDNTILSQIEKGTLPMKDIEKYLGPTVMSKLSTAPTSFYTLSGFGPIGKKNVELGTSFNGGIMEGSNIILRSTTTSGWEFRIPVNIAANAITQLKVTLKNHSTSSKSLKVYINGSTSTGVTKTISASSKTSPSNQTLTFDVASMWKNKAITYLYFDFITNSIKEDEPLEISKIEFIGYGNVTQDCTGEQADYEMDWFSQSEGTLPSKYGLAAYSGCTIGNSIYDYNSYDYGFPVNITSATSKVKWTGFDDSLKNYTKQGELLRLEFKIKNPPSTTSYGYMYINGPTSSKYYKYCIAPTTNNQTVYINLQSGMAYNETSDCFCYGSIQGNGMTEKITSIYFELIDKANTNVMFEGITIWGALGNTFTNKKLTVTYRNPLRGTNVSQTIKDNWQSLPERVDGQYNPIFACKSQELNAHDCSLGCTTHVIFNCTEPHHRGEHYPGGNKICWSACGDDSKHVNTKKNVTINGSTVRLADYVQLDAGFTVYFPNRGDFRGNDALGLAQPQITRGKGYTNGMDTTQWTREKRVKFPFEVIFDDKANNTMSIHKRGTWIELDVPTEYFNFYVLASDEEMSNVKVEFEVEAINCGTVSGTQPKKNINYTRAKDPYTLDYLMSNTKDSYNSTYKKSLQDFRDGYIKVLQNAISAGYLMSYPVNVYPKTTSNAFNEQGYWSFYFNKGYTRGTSTSTIEGNLRNTMNNLDARIETDFEGTTYSSKHMWPHTNVATSVNSKLKPVTSNDNKVRVDNKLRTNSLESLHGGYKSFYLDVIGRIGNFAITDTEDYRFSNFFKMPISAMGGADMKEANSWLVEGLVEKVRDDVQNFYVGDEYDIRGNKASSSTRWLDTYGTESWMSGKYNPLTGKRDVGTANLTSQILTGSVNNIAVLQGEQLRYGYDVFTSIITLGNYSGGNVQIIPKWYALKLNNHYEGETGFDREAGTLVPLDVYINKDGLYTPVNIFGNAENGEPNKGNYKLHDYAFNLDWTTESGRRNYTIEESERTNRIKEFLKRYVYDFSSFPEGSTDYEAMRDAMSSSVSDTIELKVPNGKNNYMGTSQYELLDGKHRTFIGSQYSYGGNTYKKNGVSLTSNWGDNKDTRNVIDDKLFERAVQRWHGKLGVPSSAVFIPVDGGQHLTPTTDTINYVMNEDWAILCTAEIIAIGDVWSLAYSQPWFTSLKINGETYSLSKGTGHYPGHRVYNGNDSVQCKDCIPPVIAVYSGKFSSVDDVEVVQTH